MVFDYFFQYFDSDFGLRCHSLLYLRFTVYARTLQYERNETIGDIWDTRWYERIYTRTRFIQVVTLPIVQVFPHAFLQAIFERIFYADYTRFKRREYAFYEAIFALILWEQFLHAFFRTLPFFTSIFCTHFYRHFTLLFFADLWGELHGDFTEILWDLWGWYAFLRETQI